MLPATWPTSMTIAKTCRHFDVRWRRAALELAVLRLCFENFAIIHGWTGVNWHDDDCASIAQLTFSQWPRERLSRGAGRGGPADAASELGLHVSRLLLRSKIRAVECGVSVCVCACVCLCVFVCSVGVDGLVAYNVSRMFMPIYYVCIHV